MLPWISLGMVNNFPTLDKLFNIQIENSWNQTREISLYCLTSADWCLLMGKLHYGARDSPEELQHSHLKLKSSCKLSITLSGEEYVLILCHKMRSHLLNFTILLSMLWLPNTHCGTRVSSSPHEFRAWERQAVPPPVAGAGGGGPVDGKRDWVMCSAALLVSVTCHGNQGHLICKRTVLAFHEQLLPRQAFLVFVWCLTHAMLYCWMSHLAVMWAEL